VFCFVFTLSPALLENMLDIPLHEACRLLNQHVTVKRVVEYWFQTDKEDDDENENGEGEKEKEKAQKEEEGDEEDDMVWQNFWPLVFFELVLRCLVCFSLFGLFVLFCFACLLVLFVLFCFVLCVILFNFFVLFGFFLGWGGIIAKSCYFLFCLIFCFS